MKKLLTLLLLLIKFGSTFAQTPEQLEELQKLTPEELAALSHSEVVTTTDAAAIATGENTIREQEEVEARALSSVGSEVFGGDIFGRENLTFAPSKRIPTPRNYIIAASDQLILSIWGASEAEYILRVSPEGDVNIPKVGLVHVGGMTIETVELLLAQKLAQSIGGIDDGTVNIKIALGDIRSISVNIVGEAAVPGSYTLPSLATVFNALYAAGGVNNIGSLRDIKLYRNGRLVTSLDVYDYLVEGRSDVDVRLEDNDLIVVAPYQNFVEIAGKVKRPMTYELKSGETLEELVEYAGGFMGDSYTQNIAVERKAGGRQYTISTVPESEFGEFVVLDNDRVSVGQVVERFGNRVTIEGAVWREGAYELSEAVATLGELIAMAEGVREDAFMGRGQIIRTREDMQLEVIPFNVGEIISGKSEDINLYKDDRVVIASVDDLLEEATISIEGEVNRPQSFPFIEGMTIEDLIFMARGLKSSASLARVEVARRVREPYAKSSSGSRATVYSFVVDEDLTLEGVGGDFKLEPFDIVFVRRSPAYSPQIMVSIEGEVNFEGEYVMMRSDDRLSTLVKMSGGVTPEAYVRGARLQRFYTADEINRAVALAKLAQVAYKQGENGERMVEPTRVKIGDSYTVGIDLEAALSDSLSTENIVLRGGDRLIIPPYNNTITISGAVYCATTTTFVPELRVKDYIKRAGGYSTVARHKPFIIAPSGKVMAVNGSYIPEAGSEIVIPYKPYREPLGAQGWIGISTSIVSMAAMIMSLLM